MQVHHSKNLDGLRALALFLVIAHHLPYFLPTLVDVHSLPFAMPDFNGSHLFFMLSGFLITWILLQSKEKSDYFTKFFGRRFWRIFPLYYVYLFIAFFVAPNFFPGLATVRNQAAFWLYYANWSLLSHETDNMLLLHTWSLAIQEQFYLFWPLYVRKLSDRTLVMMFAVMFFSSTAIRVAVRMMHGDSFAADLVPFGSFDNLALGGAVALAVHRGVLAPAAFNKARVGVLVSLALALIFAGTPLMDTTVSLVFLSVLVCALSAPQESKITKILSIGSLTRVAKHSYAIYLFHMLIMLMAACICERLVAWVPLIAPWKAIMFFAISIPSLSIVGALSYDYFERPLLQLADVDLKSAAMHFVWQIKVWWQGDTEQTMAMYRQLARVQVR